MLQSKHKTDKYRIEESESEPRGDVYELEITYYYDVIDNRTEMSIMQFQGVSSAKLGDDCTWENWQYSGVDEVEFSDDGRYVIVHHTLQKDPEMTKLPE